MKHRYLIHIQYLGFRYHGWMKQPDVKTVESVLEKTLFYVLGHTGFRLLGSSRTDAMVSADHAAFELFLETPLDESVFIPEMNLNLPNDVRVTEMEPVGPDFNIIQSPREKAYVYLFSHGEKVHPFCAPFLCGLTYPVDIERMKEGADIFKGSHNFRRYCTKPGASARFEREILESRIEENRFIEASFFPDKTYAWHIRSKGFLRNQIRLMMGHLLCLGRGEINPDEIRRSLRGEITAPLRHIAPASGLVLREILFDRAEEEKRQ